MPDTTSYTLSIVDAFITDTPFSGNPAAVVLLDTFLSDELMQAIAAQNNLSETAFVCPLDNDATGSVIKQTKHQQVNNSHLLNKSERYQIRWFSPLTEVDFCGHATLATAAVLFKRHPELKQLEIYAEAVGVMTLTQLPDGRIEMDFPLRAPSVCEQVPEALLKGLSIAPAQVLLNQQAYFAIYDSERSVHDLEYDTNLLKTLAPHDVVASAAPSPHNKTEAAYDFVSRYFWPANGGDEDPVTGSIHTGLAPYWAARLGKQQLVAYQASARGGLLFCELVAEGEIVESCEKKEARVKIAGYAKHYLEGELTL